jgi:hypothetical protein
MVMARSTDALRHLEIVSPCKVSWEGMRGDDKVRFCGTCRLNVYNLAGMTRREAERLIGEKEGRVCVRFYRRSDGTVVTRDCGAAARRLARAVFASLCAIIALLVTGTVAGLVSWRQVAGLWFPGVAQPSTPWVDAPPPVPQLDVRLGQLGLAREPGPKMGKIRVPVAAAHRK